jgi:hypothetical protein
VTEPEVLDQLFGWINEDQLRRPLPPTPTIPAARRCIGNIGGVTHVDWPPYISFVRDDADGVFMLCRPDGYRACHMEGGWAPTDVLSEQDERWIYANSANVPEEWRAPIAAALAEVGKRHPNVRIRLRP